MGNSRLTNSPGEPLSGVRVRVGASVTKLAGSDEAQRAGYVSQAWAAWPPTPQAGAAAITQKDPVHSDSAALLLGAPCRCPWGPPAFLRGLPGPEGDEGLRRTKVHHPVR